MKRTFLISLLWVFSCSSKPVIMTEDSVTVSRDQPHPDCLYIGQIKGTVQGVEPNLEQAVEDLKAEAARKGANYVRMETSSAYGTAVQGTAYECP